MLVRRFCAPTDRSGMVHTQGGTWSTWSVTTAEPKVPGGTSNTAYRYCFSETDGAIDCGPVHENVEALPLSEFSDANHQSSHAGFSARAAMTSFCPTPPNDDGFAAT